MRKDHFLLKVKNGLLLCYTHSPVAEIHGADSWWNMVLEYSRVRFALIIILCVYLYISMYVLLSGILTDILSATLID